ncbi:Canalicular multispecific organic anion transporter 2 [Asimina triloba]
MIRGHRNSKERLRAAGSFSCYKLALFSSLALSFFHFVLCVLNYFWYPNAWSNELLLIQFDLVLRTLVGFLISAYLHFVFRRSDDEKFPIFLRMWWCFYFLMCCSFVILDVATYRRFGIHPIQRWVLEFGSVVLGLILCFAGFLGKKTRQEEEAGLIDEPLLNDNGCRMPCGKSGKDSVTPYATANLFSILTFSWMNPLLRFGYRKTLDLDDVPQLAEKDSVFGVISVFRNKLVEDATTHSSNRMGTMELVKSLLFSVWKEALLSAFFAVLNTLASYVGPYLIDAFVQYLNGRREFANEGYVLVSIFVIAKLVECFSMRHWFFRLQQVGIRAQAALVAIIYRKGLTLSSHSRQSHASGEIINFMSVDAERVGDFSWYMHDLWMVPLQVALALVILYINLGLASIAAFVATVIVMLTNIPLGRLQENYQAKLMKSKDVRMKETSEILRNMRILKFQGWEMKFLSKIVEVRKEEANWLRKFLYSMAMTMSVFWGAPAFISVVTFGFCMLIGIPLESGKVLSALATFKILQVPIYKLPETISMIAQTKVSLDRIASFLCLEDLQPDAVEKLPLGSSSVAVEISNGYFSWDLSSADPTLSDFNFRVLHGMRVAVCGTVGSGKSSLLACILGELPKLSGRVRVCGTKAYVAQSPWIQSGTIEENILFGKEMDREKYDRVLEACSLKKDLEILAFGDQTVIGERGINLSGGQKQRVQIARALYQDADIYLFDDPFSAECLLRMLGSKTVIYVTHQVEFLPSADLILVMKDGRITQAGKYNDILNSGTDFMELVGAHKQALSALDSIEKGPDSQQTVSWNESSHQSETSGQALDAEERIDQDGNIEERTEQKGQLVQEEEREKGRVGISVYWKYTTMAYGGALVPFILLSQVLFQLLQIGSSYWMAWAAPVSKDSKPPVEGSLLILVYFALAIGSSICVSAKALLLVIAGYRTATLLFNKMHQCIFRAPMSFFDATPSGRILNRASTDQTAADITIPLQIGSFSLAIVQVLGVIVVMSLVAWQVFIVFIPVIAICIWYQQYYIPTARELARLIGVCKAPNIQHFAESLSGSTTIRSFDEEPSFMDKNLRLIDEYSRPKFHNAGAMEWLSFRLDMFTAIIFAFCLVFLLCVPEGVISPAIAGLAVTYGLNLNEQTTILIWGACNLENKIISIERILQYINIPSEPPLVVETNRPESNWPATGEVAVRDLQVRYAPHMPLVLRGLTCTFSGGMKIGIVGRTGSGKSTLIQTVFRIVDPVGGQILIDGVDICTIGLHDLRFRLSIIPQDPTMFEGTVRSNLDPLEEYTDEEIWEALDRCQLGDEVRRKEGKLQSTVTENGENWSMGQRQLVCLGRVLLKRSKVLVLDEATASVDTATDNLIQQTLRQEFSDCTVITIAHRITSVLDSDMVLLLDNGLIAEYDSPAKLLEKQSSLFAKLVAEYSVRSSSTIE